MSTFALIEPTLFFNPPKRHFLEAYKAVSAAAGEGLAFIPDEPPMGYVISTRFSSQRSERVL